MTPTKQKGNMKYYMHTISGKPAIFQDQIVFAGSHGIKLSEMATSLQQIRREQKLSTKYREERGWDDTPNPWEYDYILIKD